MQLGKLLIIPIALFGLKQLRGLEDTIKPPTTAVTPLIPTPTTPTTTPPTNIVASPAGFLTGVTDLTGLFTPPTVTQLKRVADPFFSEKVYVQPTRGRTGTPSAFRRPDFAVGPITGLAQSQQLDLTGFVPNVPVPTGPTFKQGGGVQL
ncbi:MAG: hypothetical protein [Circular genetic element sp.]|nr:MAG: hypothetical protein [Circular genetic element sp.]